MWVSPNLGEVAEWLKAHAWKACGHRKVPREFESLLLRHLFIVVVSCLFTAYCNYVNLLNSSWDVFGTKIVLSKTVRKMWAQQENVVTFGILTTLSGVVCL